MKSKSKYPWIVIDTKLGRYVCERCWHSVVAPQTMMSFNMMIGMMNGFRDDHKECEERANEKRQTPEAGVGQSGVSTHEGVAGDKDCD